MNGSQGIQPVVELATNNGTYPYPVYPMMGGYGNSGFGGFDNNGAIWIILIIALLGGFNNGNNGFGGNNDFAWLSNGQKDIMTNTNNGFDTLHLSNQLDTVNSGIYSLSNQLCNCCADMNQTVSNGFYNAEISANNRQMANMNQIFGLSTQVANASADNRLASCQTQNTIISEAAATRFADANNTRDIIDSNNRNSQAILDKLCQLELDGFKRENEQLRSQLQFANMQASQVEQNAFISQGFANEVDALYNRLANCPVPSTPVYGRTPIFTCPNNNGCGCGFNTTSQFI